MAWAFEQVAIERDRQDARWGPLPRAHGMGDWFVILQEEIGELAECHKQMRDGDKPGDWPANFRKELVQCMAVMAAMGEQFEIEQLQVDCNHPHEDGTPDGKSWECQLCGRVTPKEPEDK